MGPQHRRQPERADGDADAFADTGGSSFDGGDGATPVARGLDRCGLVGAGQGSASPAVHLDPAADHQVFERTALGSCSDDRCRGRIGQQRRGVGSGACIGFPHPDVDEHVRVEVDDGVDDSIVFVGVDPVEYRTIESAPRWIGIDPRQRSHPVLGLEQTRHQGAEFAPDAADEHSTTGHDMNATRTRRQIFGSALGLLGAGVAVRLAPRVRALEDVSIGGELSSAASATATAERLRLREPGALTFPVALPADLVLLDNFGGASLGGGVHQGIDIGRRDQQPGHPLVACVDGVLAEQAVLTGRMGNAWVLVDDAGDGYRYHHLQEFAPGLAVGDRVERGQVIGTMGSTGNPLVPHLHFEVRLGGPIGRPVDPVPRLSLPIAGVTVI